LLGEAQKPATAAKPLADMEVDGVSHWSSALVSRRFPHGPACYATRKRAIVLPRSGDANYTLASVYDVRCKPWARKLSRIGAARFGKCGTVRHGHGFVIPLPRMAHLRRRGFRAE
jgi:hypothetical protein